MEFSVTSEGMSTGEEYLKLFKTIIEYFMTPLMDKTGESSGEEGGRAAEPHPKSNGDGLPCHGVGKNDRALSLD